MLVDSRADELEPPLLRDEFEPLELEDDRLDDVPELSVLAFVLSTALRVSPVREDLRSTLRVEPSSAPKANDRGSRPPSTPSGAS
ncbi:MAG: hypothetical protein RIS70_558 [Planctomycetota bacterium]